MPSTYHYHRRCPPFTSIFYAKAAKHVIIPVPQKTNKHKKTSTVTQKNKTNKTLNQHTNTHTETKRFPKTKQNTQEINKHKPQQEKQTNNLKREKEKKCICM